MYVGVGVGGRGCMGVDMAVPMVALFTLVAMGSILLVMLPTCGCLVGLLLLMLGADVGMEVPVVLLPSKLVAVPMLPVLLLLLLMPGAGM